MPFSDLKFEFCVPASKQPVFIVNDSVDMKCGLACQLITVVDEVHKSSTWVNVQIHIIKYYSQQKYCFFNFTWVKVQKYSILNVLN